MEQELLTSNRIDKLNVNYNVPLKGLKYWGTMVENSSGGLIAVEQPHVINNISATPMNINEDIEKEIRKIVREEIEYRLSVIKNALSPVMSEEEIDELFR